MYERSMPVSPRLSAGTATGLNRLPETPMPEKAPMPVVGVPVPVRVTAASSLQNSDLGTVRVTVGGGLSVARFEIVRGSVAAVGYTGSIFDRSRSLKLAWGGQ